MPVQQLLVRYRTCHMPLQVQMGSLKPQDPGSSSLQDAKMVQSSLPGYLHVAEAAFMAGR